MLNARVAAHAVLVVMLGAPGAAAFASQVLVPRQPTPKNVRVSQDAAGVRVAWEGGEPPFVVVRARTKTFLDDPSLTYLTTHEMERELLDPSARPGDGRYYYQVYDKNSRPVIFSVTPVHVGDGDVLTVRGVGFSATCDENKLLFEGDRPEDAPPILDCTTTELRMRVPASATSDGIVVLTPTGHAMDEVDPCQGTGEADCTPDPVTWP